MRLIRLLRHRLRSLLKRDAVEAELERELSLHLEALTREQMAAGLDAVEARRAAVSAFGRRDVVAEQCRDTRRVNFIDDLFKDARYALRLLSRSPGFAVTAILSLALGIGANTAIFSLVDAVLLRSLPVTRPEELVFLAVAGTEGRTGAPPYPCFERVRRESPAFAGMAAFAADELRVEIDGAVEQVFGQVASGNYFDLLGVRPIAGRVMTLADETLDPAVAVVGYGFAERRFGRAAAAIGRTITFKHRAFTIVGVTPPEFWGLQPGREVDVTFPITQDRTALLDSGAWWFDAIGRLRSGKTSEEARSQADTVFRSFMRNQGGSTETTKKYFDHVELAPASRGLDRLRARYSMPLYALSLVAVMVLLIACANTSCLLLVRGAARAREFAIRLATGASGQRLLRQLLTETLTIFALGAAAGVLVAHAAIQALLAFFAIGRNPVVPDVRYDWRLAAFAAALTLIAALLTGLWPALRALRSQPQPVMKETDGRLGGAGRTGRAARALVAGQVALSLVLLVGAALFARTMVNLRAIDLGFRADSVLTMSVMPELKLGPTSDQAEPFWRTLLERVHGIPGVRSASLSVLTPLSGRDTGRDITVPGFEFRHDEDRMVHVNHVTEDFFRTFGMELLAGRAFTSQDQAGSVAVAIVNEATVRAYFSGGSDGAQGSMPVSGAIGATLRFGDARPYHVVGIVRDFKHTSLRENAPRFVFVPLWQPLDHPARMTLAIASDQPAPLLLRAVTREVHTLHAQTLVSDVVGVQEQIDATLLSERLLSILATAFATLALGLAAIGLYGVLSYSVARRRAEFGIRLALGSQRRRIVWDVIRSVIVQVGVGVAIGLPAALASARAAEGLLFGVGPAALTVYVTCAAILIAVAAIASWLPVWRACSTDPSEVLRCE